MLAAYRTNNPFWTFNSGLPFMFGDDEVVLLLKHNYQDLDNQIDKAIKLLKTYFNVPYYDCNSGKRI